METLEELFGAFVITFSFLALAAPPVGIMLVHYIGEALIGNGWLFICGIIAAGTFAVFVHERRATF